MAAKRKAISKKIRFEVFKRDSFKCQYCGASAPDVMLEIDHINPVSKGGDNNILNLITSCHSCNNGKRDRTLDDNSVIEKQRQQLEELNERRAQLEMMLQWREGIKGIESSYLEKVIEEIDSNIPGHSTNENGAASVKKWLKKFKFEVLMDSIEAAANQYLKFDSDDQATQESVNKYFAMIPRIASNKTRFPHDDSIQRCAFYARGILRNRLSYINERLALEMLTRLFDIGYNDDQVNEICRSVKSWSEFKDFADSAEEAE